MGIGKERRKADSADGTGGEKTLCRLLFFCYTFHMKWNGLKHAGQISILISISIITGACSGAISGWISARSVQSRTILVSTQGNGFSTSTEGVSSTSTEATEPRLTVVQVDQLPPLAIVPPAFADKGSSVAMVYQKSGKSVRVFRDEDMLGRAVAVTSDGWFVAPAELLGSRHLSDVMLWYNGSALTVTRGVIDHRGSVVFLKGDAKDTKAPSFARFQDVTRGLSVWVEREPESFEAMSITALFNRGEALMGTSSDVSSRRPRLSGVATSSDIGAPVWAGNGSLIGLVSLGKDGKTEFIPSSAWAPSLFGIFSDGIVKHASLGVSTVDLATIRLITVPEGLPERGAWIVSDNSKTPVIVPGSPAEKAGLKEGDVITQVDRDILDGRADLGEILIQYKPNASVTLKVIRNGDAIDIPVTLGSKAVSEELK
jgi:S1-C subfamily serine protease